MENNKKEVCEECGHDWDSKEGKKWWFYNHGFKCGRHFLWRFLLWIIILGFVFWGGVKLGELKSFFNYGYGGYGMYGMMGRDSGRYNMMPYGNFYGPGMMKGYWQWQNSTSTK